MKLIMKRRDIDDKSCLLASVCMVEDRTVKEYNDLCKEFIQIKQEFGLSAANAWVSTAVARNNWIAGAVYFHLRNAHELSYPNWNLEAIKGRGIISFVLHVNYCAILGHAVAFENQEIYCPDEGYYRSFKDYELTFKEGKVVPTVVSYYK